MRMIDADALLEHIKDLPTWWADGGGVYGQAMKYPEGMFDVDDVVASIENAPTLTQPNEPLTLEHLRASPHGKIKDSTLQSICNRANEIACRPPEGEEEV